MKKEAPSDKVEVLGQKSLTVILDEIEQNADTLHDFELVGLNTKLVKALRYLNLHCLTFHRHSDYIAQLLSEPAGSVPSGKRTLAE